MLIHAFFFLLFHTRSVMCYENNSDVTLKYCSSTANEGRSSILEEALGFSYELVGKAAKV